MLLAVLTRTSYTPAALVVSTDCVTAAAAHKSGASLNRSGKNEGRREHQDSCDDLGEVVQFHGHSCLCYLSVSSVF
jgi:hypothetical protein